MRRFSAATVATVAAARRAPAAALFPEVLRERFRQRYFHRNHILPSSSGFLAIRVIAEASIPMGPVRHGRSSTIRSSTNPAARIVSRYSARTIAFPTQPQSSSMAPRSRSWTTSEMTSRPPGLRIRNASANTAGLSGLRLMTQLLRTTSAYASGRGSFSMGARMNEELEMSRDAAVFEARETIIGVMSTPVALPAGPTRLLARNTSIPPPLPKSTTLSPGLSFACRTGFPLPSPRTDSVGIRASSAEEYPLAQHPSFWQDPTPVAAIEYRSRTFVRIASPSAPMVSNTEQ